MTVPFEATPEMVKAALDLVWEESETHSDLVSRLWRAMTAVAPDQTSAARELALGEAARLCDARAERCAEEHQAATLASVKAALAGARSEAMHLAYSIRALSSTDHAEAGKVKGDWRADLEHFWRPISEADKSITFEQTFDLGEGEKMTIRNSDRYWVRDADGRVYEAAWTDHKAGYWWDLEGESPVDPVEYMPHPLSFPSAPASEETKP
jgi:hypothetical protein